MQQRFDIAYQQTSWLVQEPFAMALNISKTDLRTAKTKAMLKVDAIIAKSGENGTLQERGKPYIINEPTIGDPISQKSLHDNVVKNIYKYDRYTLETSYLLNYHLSFLSFTFISLRGTDESLTWKTISEDLVLLAFVKDKFKSNRMEKLINTAKDGVTYATSGVILSGDTQFLTQYADSLREKFKDLGQGKIKYILARQCRFHFNFTFF